MARYIGQRMAKGLMMTGVLAAFWGCAGGAEYGMAVRVPPERRHPVKTGVQKYPSEQGFNIYDAQRASTGDARADSHAKSEGSAFCAADAKAGGTAWAEFQLGQCLDNRTNAKAAAVARFDVVYAYRDSDSDVAASGTSSKVGLKIYIKDSRERVIRKLDLVGVENEIGASKGQQQQTCEFAFELEPDLVYHYVLAGRAEVTTADKTQASARMEVKSLRLEMETKPMPAATAAAGK